MCPGSMVRTSLTALAVLVAGAGLAGCAGTPAPPAVEPGPSARPPLLPTRPSDLRIEQIEVCSLLSPTERANLGIDRFGTNDNNMAVCSWDAGRQAHRYTWLAKVDQPKRAEKAARGPGARLTSVSGFPAVQTSSSIFDPAFSCIYIIDIAPDRDFGVYYENGSKDIPGMTHEKACQQALTVAELTMAHLKAQAR